MIYFIFKPLTESISVGFCSKIMAQRILGHISRGSCSVKCVQALKNFRLEMELRKFEYEAQVQWLYINDSFEIGGIEGVGLQGP